MPRSPRLARPFTVLVGVGLVAAGLWAALVPHDPPRPATAASLPATGSPAAPAAVPVRPVAELPAVVVGLRHEALERVAPEPRWFDSSGRPRLPADAVVDAGDGAVGLSSGLGDTPRPLVSSFDRDWRRGDLLDEWKRRREDSLGREVRLGVGDKFALRCDLRVDRASTCRLGGVAEEGGFDFVAVEPARALPPDRSATSVAGVGL